jgi:RND family efflux transporter MFP subunit
MSEQRHNELGIHPLGTGDGTAAVDLLSRRQIGRRGRILAVVILILLAIGATRTVIERISNNRALETGTELRAINYVQTTVPAAGAKGQELELPGTLQGFVQSPISARASGYLKRWTADIGTRVVQGQLLAEIETPEIGQQLSQAIATRDQTAAALQLANTTLTRWISLRQKDVVSQQDLDERRGAAVQARANLAAADANVNRLKQTEGFARVLAPFPGIITRRNVDVGDLIEAGSGRPLFVLSQTDPLRIYVNVPQSYAQLIKTGQAVDVTQSELPGQVFKGTIARTSASIDAASRTMQAEVALPNPNGTLLPGAYVHVALRLPVNDTLVVPGNTLLFRAEGARVAVVDKQGNVTLRPITIGRNLGRSVEVLDGLSAADHIVVNPSDSLDNGDKVTIAPEPAAVTPPGAQK